MTDKNEGVPLDFVYSFLKQFSSNATGLDLSEVNFMSSDSDWRHTDQQTFRELTEMVLHEINRSEENKRSMNMHSYFSAKEIARTDLSM